MVKNEKQLYFLKRFASFSKAVRLVLGASALISEAVRALILETSALDSKGLYIYSQGYGVNVYLYAVRNMERHLKRLKKLPQKNLRV